jgi:hypothetical protein
MRRAAIRKFERRYVVADVSCAAGKIVCMSPVVEVIPCAAMPVARHRKGVMLLMKSSRRNWRRRRGDARSFGASVARGLWLEDHQYGGDIPSDARRNFVIDVAE